MRVAFRSSLKHCGGKEVKLNGEDEDLQVSFHVASVSRH